MTVDTDGMELYDKGEEKAWLELFRVFAGEKEGVIPGRVGILGMTPQDISDSAGGRSYQEAFRRGRKDMLSVMAWETDWMM